MGGSTLLIPAERSVLQDPLHRLGAAVMCSQRWRCENSGQRLDATAAAVLRDLALAHASPAGAQFSAKAKARELLLHQESLRRVLHRLAAAGLIRLSTNRHWTTVHVPCVEEPQAGGSGSNPGQEPPPAGGSGSNPGQEPGLGQQLTDLSIHLSTLVPTSEILILTHFVPQGHGLGPADTVALAIEYRWYIAQRIVDTAGTRTACRFRTAGALQQYFEDWRTRCRQARGRPHSPALDRLRQQQFSVTVPASQSRHPALVAERREQRPPPGHTAEQREAWRQRWSPVAEALQAECAPDDYDRWIRPLQAQFHGDDLTLWVPSRWIADTVLTQWSARIRELAAGVGIARVRIVPDMQRRNAPP